MVKKTLKKAIVENNGIILQQIDIDTAKKGLGRIVFTNDWPFPGLILIHQSLTIFILICPYGVS